MKVRISKEAAARTELTKRSVSTGLGLGALALLGGSAAADTPFSGFAFPASGTTAARTLPDRLAELRNVKDFGAIGNGLVDDAAAIQRAVNWTTGTDRGVIFFPPGTYRVNQPIVFNGRNATTGTGTDDGADIGPLSIIFQGCGKATTITGYFDNDYVFKRSNSNPTSGFRAIRDMEIKRGGTHTGAILMKGTIGGEISGIRSDCYRGINLHGDTEGVVISHCKFQAGITQGSFGILVSNACVAIGCDIQGYEHGIRMNNVGTVLLGGRIEVCDVGIMVGLDDTGASFQASGFMISGVSMESNNRAGIEMNAAAAGIITGCGVTANLPPPYECLRGIYLRGSQDTSVVGTTIAGQYAVAAVDANNHARASFISVVVNNKGTGRQWVMPTTPGKMMSIQTTAPLQTWKFADLSATPAEGDGPYLITDSNTATFRAAASAGGSNRVWVQANNNNQWLVVG